MLSETNLISFGNCSTVLEKTFATQLTDTATLTDKMHRITLQQCMAIYRSEMQTGSVEIIAPKQNKTVHQRFFSFLFFFLLSPIVFVFSFQFCFFSSNAFMLYKLSPSSLSLKINEVNDNQAKILFLILNTDSLQYAFKLPILQNAKMLQTSGHQQQLTMEDPILKKSFLSKQPWNVDAKVSNVCVLVPSSDSTLQQQK